MNFQAGQLWNRRRVAKAVHLYIIHAVVADQVEWFDADCATSQLGRDACAGDLHVFLTRPSTVKAYSTGSPEFARPAMISSRVSELLSPACTSSSEGVATGDFLGLGDFLREPDLLGGLISLGL